MQGLFIPFDCPQIVPKSFIELAASLRHGVSHEGVQRAPTTMEYGAMFAWTHARTVFDGARLVLACMKGRLAVGMTAHALLPQYQAQRLLCAARSPHWCKMTVAGQCRSTVWTTSFTSAATCGSIRRTGD